MKALRTHKNKILTGAACLLAYGLVFTVVNMDRIDSETGNASARFSQMPVDHEALADQEYYAEYFNSEMVDRAMSLNDPLPYNAHAAASPANI